MNLTNFFVKEIAHNTYLIDDNKNSTIYLIIGEKKLCSLIQVQELTTYFL